MPLGRLSAPPKSELALAQRVIDHLRHETFDPSQYTDEVKKRVRKLIADKAKGGEIIAPEHEAPARITDLMAALKASLGADSGAKEAPKRAPRGPRAKRAPAKRAHTPRKHAATPRGSRKTVRTHASASKTARSTGLGKR